MGAGQLERQAAGQRRCQIAGSREGAARHGICCRMPDKRQRQLVRKKLVKGQSAPRRRERQDVIRGFRLVNAPRRRCKIGPSPLFDNTCRYPFGKIGDAVQRPGNGAAQGFRGQPCGEGVGRFDQRHLIAVRRINDVVGMRHLRTTLANFDTAADKASFARWQGPGDIIVPRVEENDLEPPAFVLCDDAPWAAGSGWRPIMLHNQNLECGHAAIDNVVE